MDGRTRETTGQDALNRIRVSVLDRGFNRAARLRGRGEGGDGAGAVAAQSKEPRIKRALNSGSSSGVRLRCKISFAWPVGRVSVSVAVRLVGVAARSGALGPGALFLPSGHACACTRDSRA